MEEEPKKEFKCGDWDIIYLHGGECMLACNTGGADVLHELNKNILEEFNEKDTSKTKVALRCPVYSRMLSHIFILYSANSGNDREELVRRFMKDFNCEMYGEANMFIFSDSVILQESELSDNENFHTPLGNKIEYLLNLLGISWEYDIAHGERITQVYECEKEGGFITGPFKTHIDTMFNTYAQISFSPTFIEKNPLLTKHDFEITIHSKQLGKTFSSIPGEMSFDLWSKELRRFGTLKISGTGFKENLGNVPKMTLGIQLKWKGVSVEFCMKYISGELQKCKKALEDMNFRQPRNQYQLLEKDACNAIILPRVLNLMASVDDLNGISLLINQHSHIYPSMVWSKTKQNILHVALLNDYPRIVEYAMQRRVKLDEPDINGMTPTTILQSMNKTHPNHPIIKEIALRETNDNFTKYQDPYYPHYPVSFIHRIKKVKRPLISRFWDRFHTCSSSSNEEKENLKRSED